ncbi:MAG: SAM-dependent methyltransferase [Lachnospiraceae bacterium]|nr:SAM-dependent methyltransferase [Lachnospiraceae bacterium]
MELSFRMKQVADMVEPCHGVADIGCDHGYVSIYLIEQGIAQQVLAMDVRTGPLSRAERNVKEKHLEDRIQCRLSDGLEQLQAGEVETIVIAGMGGPLMIRILEQGAGSRLGTETLILQPQSEIPVLRQYLHKIGYGIVEEAMLLEAGKYYTVIKAKPLNNICREANMQMLRTEAGEWKPVEYQYGRYLLEQQSSVLQQYLLHEKKTLEAIANRLMEQQTEKAQERLLGITEQLKWNREAQDYYEA